MYRWQKIWISVLSALSLILLSLSVGFSLGVHEDSFGSGSGDGAEVIQDAFDRIKRDSVDPPSDEDLTKAAIDAMVELLKKSQDPYASFYGPRDFDAFKELSAGEFSGIGIWLPLEIAPGEFLQVIKVLPKTPALAAGIRRGDLIRSIDGVDVRKISSDEAVNLIKGPTGSQVTLDIERDGKAMEFTITRQSISLPNLEARLTRDDIGYIRLFGFARGAGSQVRAEVKSLVSRGAGGILLDLRNNPGGLFSEAINVASLFIEDGGVVIYRERGKDDVLFEAKGDAFEDVPLVVLINEGSASASEIVAGALQDSDRAQLVGMVTYGKALVQEVSELGDGSALKLTTAAYLTPNGDNINGSGIEPDFSIVSPMMQQRRAVDLLKDLVGSSSSGG